MDIEYIPETKVVLIYGHEPQVVAVLRDRIEDLATQRIDALVIHDLPGFRAVGGCELIASCGTSDHGVQPDPNPPAFRCELKSSTWRDIADLLEPFSDGRYFAANHQYLDEHGDVQLIISGGKGW